MEDSSGNRLVHIQVIHRHGARSPESGLIFPSICGSAAFRTFFRFRPHIPSSPPLYPTKQSFFTPSESASCYKGQLTPVGAAQMFALGARLRARYALLLPDEFDPDVVQVRSTAVVRTVESAVATLSGMFPAGGPTDVTIEVRPRDRETLLAFRRGCNRLFDLQQAAYASFAFPEVLTDAAQQWFEPRMEVGEGRRRTLALRDIAIAMRENGCEPQPWEKVAEPLAMGQIMKLYGREYWGLGLGRFAEELLQEASSHASNAWRCKIYSGHDTTLLPLMALFENGARRGVPDFAADLVVETWVPPTEGVEPLVRLKYEGKDVQISGCEKYGTLCPVSVVKEAVRKHIPDDWHAACGGTLEQRKRERSRNRESDAAEGTTL